MRTLIQLQAPLSSLKAVINDMARHWQAGDAILLLGETCAYADWMYAYIAELNDDGSDTIIKGISAVYVLQDDIGQLSPSAQSHLTVTALDIDQISTIDIATNGSDTRLYSLTDEAWVTLTQAFDRVLTLSGGQTL